MNLKKITLLFCLLTSLSLSAQDDLMNMLDDGSQTTNYTYATFKTTRVVIGQSIENPASGNLNFVISHHFGHLNEGAYELFGLDKSTIRLGLEYGINDRFAIGLGRSTYQKTVDGSLKYKVLRQSTGKRNMPISLSYYGSITMNTLKWADPERKNYFSSRLSYIHQLLIARKINDRISMQLTPSIVHKNLVPKIQDPNTIYVMGAGGRVKLTNRMSLNVEYHHILSSQTSKDFDNSLSIGFDIETGGHVFQLFFTNSQPLFERGFLTETLGTWRKADIYFGFNISRSFVIKKPKSFR